MQQLDDLELAAMGVKRRQARPWGWFVAALLAIGGVTFLLSFYVPLKTSYDALLAEHENVAKKARELDDALVATKGAFEATDLKRANLQKLADERAGAESAVGEKVTALAAAVEKALGPKRASDPTSLETKGGRVVVGLDRQRTLLPGGKVSPAALKPLCAVAGVAGKVDDGTLRVVVPVALQAKATDWADASKGSAALLEALMQRCKLGASRVRAEVLATDKSRVLLVVAAGDAGSSFE